MTTVQKREYVRKALRNSRKFYRAMDSAGELLERNLDRLIERKTLVTREQLNPLVDQMNNIWKTAQAFEGSITSLLQISAM